MTDASEPYPVDAATQVLASISNEMVRVYKDVFGRGPTRARTYWSGEDTIVATLEDTFTRAERQLQTMGEDHRLHDLRVFLQQGSIKEFCEPVERLTGRKVRAFVSGIDPREDVAVELFMLHPVGYDGPSRADSR